MYSRIEIQHILPETNYTCFVIPGLFSKTECESLLNSDIKNSFQKAIANYPTYYRNNDRFVVDSEELAAQLFVKVKPYLPGVIETNSDIQSENGVWHLKELNSRLRFCRYSANQYFNRHLDGVHYQNETTQSKLTFMIYLNGAVEFGGGRTLFFKTKETAEIWASYTPKQGDLIVFDHNVWHEGEMLTRGEKFVLRSDILYSKKETAKSKAPFTGHLGYVWSLLKLNNDTILSGGRDKATKVWSASGEEKTSLHGHNNSILCLEKMSNDVFISGSRDKQILVWKDFRIQNRITIHSAVILSLCRLNDHTFASGSGDNTIKIAALDGTVLQTFTGHTNWVWKIVELNQNVLASCSEDGSIQIWDIQTGKMIVTFYETKSVISLAYNKQTRQLVSGNLTGELSIRTLDNNYQQQEIKRVKAHHGIIRTICFINDELLASGGEDNNVHIWNLKGELKQTLEHQNFVQAVEVLDNHTILSASYDGTIKIWDLESLIHQ